MSKVPAGWHIQPLEAIATITSGGTPSRANLTYWNGNIPWVTTAEVHFNEIKDTKEKITKIGLDNSSAKVFPSGTLLMAMYGQGKTRGQVAKLKIDASTNQACAAILLKKGFSADYYYLYLESQYENIRDMSNSGGQKNLSGGLIKSIPVPVPPLSEQTKIAQILSTWDKAISTTEQLIDNSQQQKKALMQSLLTGKKRLPGFEGEWQLRPLKNIVSIIYGKSPKDIFQDDGKYPVIGTGGITGRTNKYLTADKSVILGRKGTIDKPMMVNSPFWAIDTTFYCQPMSNVDITWFYYWVSNIDLRIYNEASGVPSISRENLYAIQVVLPPLPEQQKIAAVLTAADNEIELLQNKLAFLKQEKNALMQQLLTGKRRVKINATEECMDA